MRPLVDNGSNNPFYNEWSTNQLTEYESSGILRNRTKRFAQPRIIRVRASASETSFALSSYDSATLSGPGDVTTNERKIKGFRFDSTTFLGSKSNYENSQNDGMASNETDKK